VGKIFTDILLFLAISTATVLPPKNKILLRYKKTLFISFYYQPLFITDNNKYFDNINISNQYFFFVSKDCINIKLSTITNEILLTDETKFQILFGIFFLITNPKIKFEYNIYEVLTDFVFEKYN